VQSGGQLDTRRRIRLLEQNMRGQRLLLSFTVLHLIGLSPPSPLPPPTDGFCPLIGVLFPFPPGSVTPGASQ
jgi:hypothetical protein